MDIESTRLKPDWRMVGIEGKKEIEFSEWVPRRILYFNTFVEELFNTKTLSEAFDLIDAGQTFLRSLEGARLQGGPVSYANKNLVTFENKKQGDIDFTNPEDENLRELERKVVDE
jgi:hypothetical protein